MTGCLIENCSTNKTFRKNLCRTHYERERLYGDPLYEMEPKSYPPEPLLKIIDGMTNNGAAKRLGVSRRTIIRWRQGCRVGANAADRATLNLGLNIQQVWGEQNVGSR